METCPVLISARSAGDLIAAVQPAARIGATDTLKAQQKNKSTQAPCHEHFDLRP